MGAGGAAQPMNEITGKLWLAEIEINRGKA
jgi:hypothetical protein